MKKGKFIVFYGVNNLGKSTQIKRLIAKLTELKIPVEYLKYAVYDLAPSGPIINEYLRKGNPYSLTPREFQIMQIVNRTHYESVLKQKLDEGTWIIAEDYTGTGIAWGVGAGVDKDFLIRANSHLLKEDLALFFYGTRFASGIEKVHTHEQNDELTRIVAATHEELADLYGWKKVFANQTEDEVFAQVFDIVKSIS